jgi:hypothetical protein
MNIHSFNTRAVKTIAASAAAIVLFVSNPLTSHANGGVMDKGGIDIKKISLGNEQVSVQYLGANETSLIFRVNLENPSADKFSLIIKDDEGEIVYHKQYNDVHFSKIVYFQKEEITTNHPTFVIRTGNTDIVRQFAVNRTVTENTVVTEL